MSETRSKNEVSSCSSTAMYRSAGGMQERGGQMGREDGSQSVMLPQYNFCWASSSCVGAMHSGKIWEVRAAASRLVDRNGSGY